MKRADLILALVVLGGALGSPFYNTALVRSQLIGDAPVGVQGGVAVLCVGLAMAWRATTRRGHLWADPAALTWSDFDGSRPRTLTRRLLVDWAARFAAAGYAFAMAGVLIGFPADLGGALGLFVGVAGLALALARRARVWGEAVLPLVPVLGVLPFIPLWTLALVAASAAVALGWSTPLARTAGRRSLVHHFAERMVRRTSAAFLDVWALLPAGRPVRWRTALDGRFVVTRYLVTGVLARRHQLGLPLFLALAVAAAHVTFPAVTSVWLVGMGGYLALLPFAAPVAQVYRVPGLRRWFDASDLRLKATTVVVLAVLAVVWTAFVALLRVPMTVGAVVAALLAAVAVVRTVTRGALDFGSLGLVLYEGVLVPMGLARQLVRGPDVLLVGLIAASFLPG
ncbi:hypothetical protein [Amycolatopsis saalfeldensis]|uniref:ABC-2 type transport system permease protein n=1 Tax=Amycolatopsis saalfeldensis TaxID=394193 RepID=A0A1H8YIS8_9PSEU|nr:hypothetical protein [Amycolatopsis saalfeldensis]SEP52080.1 hypothetical protein SAMN04489732_118176 [Amycolatopsis saalfeldensis]